MATSAAAQESFFALRREIARIEGRLAERLEDPPLAGGEAVLYRRHGLVVPGRDRLATGVEGFDSALAGGLERAALTEIHSAETRDSAAASGFALALASRLPEARTTPLLWIGTSEVFREAGFPYALGLRSLIGIDPGLLLVAQARKLPDALWIAEEAAELRAFSAVLLEIRGNPARLDLTATRRLHRRARNAGRPLFLIRQAGLPDPTAAPIRLVVSPALAGERKTFGGPLSGSIGPPGFNVVVSKSRSAPSAQFTLEWNANERAFQERRAENPVPVVPVPQHRTDIAAKAGTRLAFRYREAPAADRQQPGEECAPHRRSG